MLLEDIHQLILERNARETVPFMAVHEANARLLNQLDGLQLKCEALERENVTLSSSSSGNGVNSDTAALRNETRLREKLERLQEELNVKLKVHQSDTAQALETANSLASLKDEHAALESQTKAHEKELVKKDKAIQHLEQQIQDQKGITKLAEQQYNGLKETIRSLQKENDVLKDENNKMIERLVSEKGKASDELNTLNEMVDALKKEVDMLRTLKLQDDKRKGWFGSKPKEETTTLDADNTESRKFGATGSIVPSTVKHTVDAHRGDSTCVRYDPEGNLVATCGSDSFVKVWDTESGVVRATLRGTSVITACDISDGGLVAGGGSDKMCRVWNVKTERMIHQLVGHANKITCVRIFGNDRAVITGSADRSMKVWDISRKTYRQSVTLRHSSTCYAVDVASDSFTTVSGHMDGGLRCWDVRTGDRTGDVEGLHQGGVTSVQFHPTNPTLVLTNGKDSCLKVVDMRTGMTVLALRDIDFTSAYTHSAAAWSPDGMYAASVSGAATGQLCVWRTKDGKLVKKLPGHKTSASGIAWGSGGTNGQQVASVDRQGKLILWA